jgi:hypothetical protein
MRPEGEEPVPGRGAEVAADGSFRIEGVPPVPRVGLWIEEGPNAKTVSAAMPMAVRDVEVGGEPVAIRLSRGVFIEGIAIGPDGEWCHEGDGSWRTFAAVTASASASPSADFSTSRGVSASFPWTRGPPCSSTKFRLRWRVPLGDRQAIARRGAGARRARHGGPGDDASGRVRETGEPRARRWNPRAGDLSRLGTAIGPDGSFAVTAFSRGRRPAVCRVPDDDRYAVREASSPGPTRGPRARAWTAHRGRVTGFTGGRAG